MIAAFLPRNLTKISMLKLGTYILKVLKLAKNSISIINDIEQFQVLTHYAAMCPDVPYFGILLCLTADNFTCQGESAGV